jgi:hypothetical protein
MTGSGAAPLCATHRRQVRAGGQRRHARRGEAAPRRGLGDRARRPGREDHHLQQGREDGREDRRAVDERQVRVGHGRHHRQVHDQGRACPRGVVKLHFDDSKLHHVAAKCGVFAETDIVNLVKSGIPSNEMPVLARRRHRAAEPERADPRLPEAQGAPARRAQHLPALPAGVLAPAHPADVGERGYDYPKDIPIEELIFVPENAQYYAAFGACVYGMKEAAGVGLYGGRGPRRVHDQRSQGAPRRERGPAPREDAGRARGLPHAVRDPEVRTEEAGARADTCAA